MSGVDSLLKWNCSTIFLLSPLGLDKQRLDKIGFKEAYLKDEYSDVDYKNPVFLLFKPDNLERFQVFVENEYTRVNHFTQTIDIRADYNRKEGEVVLVYEFPYERDYKKFLKGKYSQFSEEIIKTYPKTLKSSSQGHEILGIAYRIITKDRESQEILDRIYGETFLVQQPILTMAEMLEDRYGTEFTEDMELWSLPNIEKETLRYGEYNKITEK